MYIKPIDRSLSTVPLGAAALTCVTLLLVLASLAGSFAANMIQLNLKITRNAQQTLLVNAQARSTLNSSISLLQSSLSHYQHLDDAFEDEHYGYQTSHQIIDAINTPVTSLVQLSATVAQQDSAAHASHQQTIISFALLTRIPPAPVIAKGRIVNSHKTTIVANANGAGKNIPVSVWTPSPFESPQHLPTTCQQHEFTQSNCSIGWYTRPGFKGADIIDRAAHFPDDLLQFLSPFSMQDWRYLKDQATEVQGHCDNLFDLSGGLIWIEGDCNIPLGVEIGNPDTPIILVIENGDISLSSGSSLYGIILLLQQDEQRRAQVDIFGRATVLGSIISTASLEFSRGHLDIIYAADILKNLQSTDLTRRLTPLPGSWRNF